MENDRKPAAECAQTACNRLPLPRMKYCQFHRRCQRPDCGKAAVPPFRNDQLFCLDHGGGRQQGGGMTPGGGTRPKQRICEQQGCTKTALYPLVQGQLFCHEHGGGYRCGFDGCGKPAPTGSPFCRKHGGGKRCQYENCDRAAFRSTPFCQQHGGAMKCQYDGCQRTLTRARATFCPFHGGGCQFPGCTKNPVGNGSYCRDHGRGPRCQFEGCKLAAQRRGADKGYCVKHGRSAMPGGAGKRCEMTCCANFIADGTARFCAAHATEVECKPPVPATEPDEKRYVLEGEQYDGELWETDTDYAAEAEEDEEEETTGAIYKAKYPCEQDGCDEDAVVPSIFCRLHGGIVYCQHRKYDENGNAEDPCDKIAMDAEADIPLCKDHGGKSPPQAPKPKEKKVKVKRKRLRRKRKPPPPATGQPAEVETTAAEPAEVPGADQKGGEVGANACQEQKARDEEEEAVKREAAPEIETPPKKKKRTRRSFPKCMATGCRKNARAHGFCNAHNPESDDDEQPPPTKGGVTVWI